MARETNRIVVCGNCGNELDVPPPRSGLTPAERFPCPNCGSTARQYRIDLSASVRVGGDPIVETPEPGGATAGGFEPTAVAGGFASTHAIIEERVAAGTFERRVVWSQNPDAWLAEVRDSDGNLVGVQLRLDVDDVFLDLYDDITPPQ